MNIYVLVLFRWDVTKETKVSRSVILSVTSISNEWRVDWMINQKANMFFYSSKSKWDDELILPKEGKRNG